MLKKSLSKLGWDTAEIGLGISEFWPMGVKHLEWKAMRSSAVWVCIDLGSLPQGFVVGS